VPRGAVEAHPRAASDAAARPSLVLRESQARRFERNQVAEVRNREQKLQRFARKIALDRVLRPASFVHWPFDETAGDFAAVQVTGTSSADSNKPGTPVLPLPTRNERGENQGEGKVQETRPALPNPLLPFPGREGEARATSTKYAARLAFAPLSTHATARAEGRWGRALNCDGQLTATALLPPFAQRNPLTVAFWIKVPPDASVAESEPILSGPLASNGDPVEFAWNRAPHQGAFGALRTSVGRGFIIGTTPLRDGQWHHVAVVFSHSLRGPQKMQIKQYVDGRLDRVSAKHFIKAKVKGLGGEPRVVLSGTETLAIGRRQNEQGTAGFRGAIDELFLLDRALSQKEIRILMQQNRLPTRDALAAN